MRARLLDEAARLLVNAQRIPEAVQLCVNARYYTGAAEIAEQGGDWDHAARLWFRSGNFLRSANARLQNNEELAAAELFERVGNFIQAAEIYERHNDRIRAANLYEKGGEDNTAATLLVGALKEHSLTRSEAHEACRRAGVLYASAGDVDRAVAVLRLGNQNVFAGQLLFQEGRHEEAIQLLSASGDLLAAAEIARAAGDENRRSVLLGERALKEGRLLEAASHFEQAGQFGSAATMYEYANELSSAAEAHERAGQPQVASRLYEEVGRFDDAVRCMRMAGDESGAFQVEQRLQNPALTSDVTRQGDLISNAQTLLMQARGGQPEKYTDVIAFLKKVPENNTDYFEAQALLASVLAERGNRAEALRVQRRLLGGMMPNRSQIPVLYEYGKLLELEGHLAEARTTYRAIVDLDPSFMDVKQRLMQLGDVVMPPRPPPVVGKPLPDIVADEPTMDEEVLEAPQAPPSSAHPLVGSVENVPQSSSSEIGSLYGVILRGRFRVEKLLGSGSQAQVYLARDVVLDRLVAIKVLNKKVAEDRKALERFLSEARYAAKVHHSNCLAIYDFGQESGVTFIAMEYFAGETLNGRMAARGAFPVEDVLRIAQKVADALGAVHSVGIIHRDVKPSNIMIDASDNVRLADFGVAVISSPHTPSKGKISGTVRYMAPEQGTGDNLDHRADIFALGVMAWEMLAGTPPFAATIQSLISRATNPPPELPEHLAVSPTFRGIIRRCMSPSPADRYESMVVLVEALEEQIAEGSGSRGSPDKAS